MFFPDPAFNQSRQYQNESISQSAIDTLNKNRLILASAAGGTAYAVSAVALYNTWYRNFPQSGFHLYNDWGEWERMDKMGHVFSAYFQTDLTYQTAKWTGMKDRNALLVGGLSALLFQSTIEVMDGFSTNWGFSVPDFAANLVGIGSYTLQQGIWGDQRMRWKFSSFPKSYPIMSIEGRDPATRAEQLYGMGFLERLLKDYNAQTIWLSINPRSFFDHWRLPAWLNIAFGYGADNLYGGFSNSWVADGKVFDKFEDAYPRHRQFYLSLDIDLSRIEVASPFLRTVLDLLNVLKWPFSTLEFNTLGEVKFRIIHF